MNVFLLLKSDWLIDIAGSIRLVNRERTFIHLSASHSDGKDGQEVYSF